MTTERILDSIWLLPALPLLGATILFFFGKRIGEPLAGWIATLMTGLAFVWGAVAFFALRSLPVEERAHVSTLWKWMPVGSFRVDFAFLADPLSITFVLFITFVATLIHIYAIGYMHGDARFSRFFAYLNLFVAAMLILVLGENLLVTFMGWEGVGLCSYFLISFWFERNSAAVAGKKAFVTNRIGDFGLMLGMFLIVATYGSLSYTSMPTAGKVIAASTCTAIALLLFVGAMGKSAQFPLHIWLPDAMEGPTPVSALIHAATMVTAGVFLMCRAWPFLVGSGYADDVVAWVGVGTALYAATVALVQTDIKRVLAYSTISQLGYCFLAVGVGAFSAGIFHVVTHAFFKALLFLGAGSVIHGMHSVAHKKHFDEQDMRWMGALRKLMPVTAATFIVGWLAIAGVPPFSGFWSKDEILAKVWSSETVAGGKVLWFLGLAAAILTAFYMTRQVWMVFFGNARWEQAPEVVPVVAGGMDDEPVAAPTDTHAADAPAAEEAHGHGDHDAPHESPALMTIPLVILAIGAMFAGLFSLPFHHWEFLAEWLEPAIPAPVIEVAGLPAVLLACLTVALGLVGIFAAVGLYRRGFATPADDPLPKKLGPLAPVLANAWYVNAAVAWMVDHVAQPVANFLANVFDQRIVDGAINGTANVVRLGGVGLRRVQTGLVRNYALSILAGLVALLIYVIVRVA
ncbi:MAG: NADH-quinone oxidoreductase subunit L [Acidimicrobiia bacterium]